ncbi:MAG: tetratricopeptide repeat protein [Spirochaetia bacterium]|nr:tetratricopeptide repeat protein [Spirochaetia bacterium]
MFLRRAGGLLVAMVLLLSLVGCRTSPQQRELAETYYNLGNAYIELEDWGKAENAFARALEIEPNMYRAGYNMARVHIYSQNYSKAAAILHQLLEADRGNITFLETLAWVELKRGKIDQAQSLYRSLIEKDPANCNVRYNLSLLLSERQEYAEAYSLLLKCVYGKNSDAELLLLLGQLEQKLEWGSGLGWFERAFEQDPQNQTVLSELAAAYVKERDFTEALDIYRQMSARAEEAEKGRFLLQQARILLVQLEENTRGIAALKGALEAGFRDVATLSALYTALDEQNKAEALSAMEAELQRVQLFDAVEAAVEEAADEASPSEEAEE